MIAVYYNVVAYVRQRSSGATYYTYVYYYNSLLVANVNPDLSIEWLKVIPKKQISTNDYGYYSSYTSMVKEDFI